MPNRAKLIATRITLLCGSLTIGLLLCEGLVRLFSVPSSGAHELFCQFDSTLGWKKIPGFSGRHVTAEYDVLESFNSRGLRGPEYQFDKREETRRVLVLGDSFVEGYCVPFDATLAQVMQRELNDAAGTKVEIINGGTGGYSTDQQLLFYRQEGRRYRPEITILAWHDNDLLSNVRTTYWRGSKPMFQLASDGSLELANTPLSVPSATASAYASTGLRGWLDANSRLYGLARAASKRSSKMQDLLIAAGVASPAKEARFGALLEAYRRHPTREVEYAWKMTEALLLELNRDVKADGGRLIVCYVPPRFQVRQSLRAKVASDSGIAMDDLDWSSLTQRLPAICSRHDVPYIDPTEDFRYAERLLTTQGESHYFPIDGHWNEHGHRLIGELLARWVEEHDWHVEESQ